MTTTQASTCPSWCDLPAGKHEVEDRGMPEDERTEHRRTVDTWQPRHEDSIKPIRVSLWGCRHASGNDFPDEVHADGDVHPGFLGGVGLRAADARRLEEALIRAADLIEGGEQR